MVGLNKMGDTLRWKKQREDFFSDHPDATLLDYRLFCSRRSTKKWKSKNPDYFPNYYLAHKEIYNETTDRLNADPVYRNRQRKLSNAARKRRNKVRVLTPSQRIGDSCRRCIKMSLRRLRKSGRAAYKHYRTMELLGCDINSYMIYLERLFEAGMSWQNYGNKSGQWNIDHIVPRDLFDLTKPEHQRICFHFSNTRPIWALENSSKAAKCNQTISDIESSWRESEYSDSTNTLAETKSTTDSKPPNKQVTTTKLSSIASEDA